MVENLTDEEYFIGAAPIFAANTLVTKAPEKTFVFTFRYESQPVDMVDNEFVQIRLFHEHKFSENKNCIFILITSTILLN